MNHGGHSTGYLCITYTDLINALFSNNNFYLKAIREFGMNAIDKSQLLKSFFTKEAAGEYEIYLIY